MSAKDANDFLQKFSTDQEFRKAILDAENIAERLEISRKNGFDFDEKELLDILKERTDELSDDELLLVAGGENRSGSSG